MHNSASTIIRCVDSLLSQVFDDFEVIIVDDGSTDSSVLTVEEGYGLLCGNTKTFHYADSTVTMTLLGYKDNQGVSYARNMGIEHAQGEWLAFVDSDDYVREDFLGILYNAAIKNNADVAWCGYVCVDDTNKHISDNNYDNAGRLLTGEEFRLLFPRNTFTLGAVWNKLYKTSVIHENCIRQEVGRSHGEDWLFNMDVASHVNRIITIRETPYYYNRQLNICTSLYRETDIDYKFQSYAKLLKFIQDNNLKPDKIMFEEKITFEFSTEFLLLFAYDKNPKKQLMHIVNNPMMNRILRYHTSSEISLKARIIWFLLRHKQYSLATFIGTKFSKYKI